MEYDRYSINRSDKGPVLADSVISKTLAILLVVAGAAFSASCGREAPYFEPHPGALAVRSNPPGAAIALDGVPTGSLTPDTLLSVAPGEHVVRVFLDGYASDPDSLVITLNPTEMAQADFELSELAPGAPRVLLFESFSNVSCVGCPALAAELYGLMGRRGYGPERVLLIKYSMSWPLVTDPMHQANTADNNARMSFYQGLLGGGIPTLVGNGALLGQSGNPLAFEDLLPLVDEILAGSPGFAITVEAPVTGTEVPVTVTLTSDRRVNLSGCVLNVALVENPVQFESPPGSEGETEFHWVMRDFAADASALPALEAGRPLVRTVSLARNTNWLPENLSVVAFVQNSASKTVLQAGSSLVGTGIAHPVRSSDGPSLHTPTAGGKPR
jgi:hypothetical protein